MCLFTITKEKPLLLVQEPATEVFAPFLTNTQTPKVSYFKYVIRAT